MGRALLALLLVLPAAAADAGCDGATPGPLWGAALVYDPLRDVVVLFGGARDRREFVGATWTWDGAGWRCHEVPGPSARAFAAAAFDPERGLVVLHGGRGAENETLGDTWAWDGAAWRRASEEGPRLDHHRAAWSSSDSAVLIFGGWDGSAVAGRTWLWNGRSWTALEVSSPPPRSAFAMAADPVAGRVVVHGGLWIEGQYADAWEWDGERWAALWGPYDHSSVDHHGMVFDRAAGRFLLFGGKNYRYRVLGRSLSLAGSVLETLEIEGPAARHSFGLTYDEKRLRAVLYGGKVYRGERQIALDDLWLWDGSSWSAWRPPDPPERLELPPAIP